jgi:pyruvate/2-oxoglutarate/acetoin dehydrogenase E1 component
METLAVDPRTIFIGQSVACAGTFMSGTLEDIPQAKRIEFPVAEAMQAGVSIGLALAGHIPICIFPRFNFMILAADMLVNHLDKFGVHVIVRVGVGSSKPLDPGDQHKGDYTDAFKQMMPNTYIAKLEHADDIIT